MPKKSLYFVFFNVQWKKKNEIISDVIIFYTKNNTSLYKNVIGHFGKKF